MSNYVRRAREKCSQLIKTYYSDKDVKLSPELFEKEILLHISQDAKVLDAGCGSDAAVISKYWHLVAEAVGVDLVEEFRTNSNLVKTYTANLESLPFADNYFDVILSRSVCEHLVNPLKVFKELHRVLKWDGKIIMLIPNKYYYSSIISRLIPMSFKEAFFKKVFEDEAYDNFPTFYRCNTKRAIRKLAKKGLKLKKFISIRHYPYYLMFSDILFKIGMLYDFLITSLGLDFLQSYFLVVLVKEDTC